MGIIDKSKWCGYSTGYKCNHQCPKHRPEVDNVTDRLTFDTLREAKAKLDEEVGLSDCIKEVWVCPALQAGYMAEIRRPTGKVLLMSQDRFEESLRLRDDHGQYIAQPATAIPFNTSSILGMPVVHLPA